MSDLLQVCGKKQKCPVAGTIRLLHSLSFASYTSSFRKQCKEFLSKSKSLALALAGFLFPGRAWNLSTDVEVLVFFISPQKMWVRATEGIPVLHSGSNNGLHLVQVKAAGLTGAEKLQLMRHERNTNPRAPQWCVEICKIFSISTDNSLQSIVNCLPSSGVWSVEDLTTNRA